MNPVSAKLQVRYLGIAGLLFAKCVTSTALAENEDDVEVQITGTTVDRRASADATAASTVLRRSDLSSPGASSATVLTQVPGVQIQQTGSTSDLATASIRGTTSAQVPVYLAGIRLNDDLSGTADLSTIPLWMLDRIEIYRGNAPANSELLGIGGAVMFEPRLPTGNEARLGADWGSWGQKSIHAALGQGSDKAQSLVAIRHESARNDYSYFNNNNTAFYAPDDHWAALANSDQTTTDGWALGRYRSGNTGQVLLLANVFDREQGAPGLPVIAAIHARAHIRRELFGVSGTSEIACAAAAPCSLNSATSFQSASTTLADPDLQLALGAPELVWDSRRAAQLMQFTWPLAARWTLVPSASLSAENLSISRTAPAPLNAKRLQVSAGTSLKYKPVDSLTLLGAARFDVESTQGTNATAFNSLPTGRLGAAYEVMQGWTLLTNAGYYSRVPTLGELYGISAIVAGNARLKPESGFNQDVGIRYSLHTKSVALSVEAFAFQQNLNDLVAWHKSSFVQITPYNVGEARLRGLENLAALDLLSIIRLESTTTLLDPRDVSAARPEKNDILPYRSRLVTVERIELHTPHPVRPLRITRASISLRGAHRSSRYQDRTGLINIPHSTTFDIETGVEFSDLPISVSAAVYNLADATRFDVVGYPLPPRTWAIGAALEWERTR